MKTHLPIRFEAEIVPARWVLVQGFADKWRLSHKCLGLSVEVPELFGSHAFFSVDDLNPQWRARLTEEKRRILKTNYVAAVDVGRNEEIQVLVCRPVPDKGVIPVHDLRKLREEFFELNQHTDDLLNFLNRYGMWRLHFNRFGAGWTPVLSTQKNPLGNLLAIDRKDRIDLQIATPEAIWRDGTQLKERMRSGSELLTSWFATSQNRMVLEPIDEFPYYAYTVRSIGDAIEASIGFDLLQGSQFALCARVDCSRPFEVTRKDKLYCSYGCAHLEVVRRSRRPGTRRTEK